MWCGRLGTARDMRGIVQPFCTFGAESVRPCICAGVRVKQVSEKEPQCIRTPALSILSNSEGAQNE